MLQPGGDTKLFSKLISVAIKDGLSQCRNCRLLLTVEWKEKLSAIQRKELMINLTDPNDPFFLYHVYISDDDFQRLKSTQGLLVDFFAFPQKFIDLLELCLSEENNLQPKFLLILNLNNSVGCLVGDSQLDVVETNPFKHLVHLSLKFHVASDSDVRQYLSTSFNVLKDEKNQLQNRLTFLEQDSRQKQLSYEDRIKKLTQEIETARKEWSVELSVRDGKHARELREEREKYLSRQKEDEERFERERKDRDRSHRKDIQHLENKLEHLDAANKDLLDKLDKSSSTIRDLKLRLSTCEVDLQSSEEACRDLRSQSEVDQADLKDRSRIISRQKDKIEELEADIRQKIVLLDNYQSQMGLHKEKIKSLDDEIKNMRKEFEKAIKDKFKLERDIDKGNDIIKTYQTEVKSLKVKLAQVEDVLKSNRKEILKKADCITTLRKELKDAEKELNNKAQKARSLSFKVEDLERKLAEAEKSLQNEQKIGSYLTKQLTDKIIMPKYDPHQTNHFVSPLRNQEVNENVLNHRTEAPKSSPLNTSQDAPKSFPLRTTPNHPSPQQTTHYDSAYVSHTTPHHPVLDSASLEAAFGSNPNRPAKHSTAKKTSAKSQREQPKWQR